ncbi:hypothetical protein, partial [Nonomuraea sp. NPDC049784]|uniref:hypothetical protein n=1 Tax=Nonomuraea sp. NPDC049784 TaxID=3154361 RepID=UPI0033E1068C
TDPGEGRDLAATRVELADELTALLDDSIGPDPRIPYGLKTELTGSQVVVTLHNGSPVPWRKVQLSLNGVRAYPVPLVDPGTAITVGFPIPGAGRITARARFTSDGRSHAFRVRADGRRGRAPASPTSPARRPSPAAPPETLRPQA